jgi:O-antigen biosynthesis protein
MGENTEKLSLPPDLYARNTVVSFLAGKICTREKPSILDVGGHNGRLAQFFADYSKFIILDRKQKPKDETCEYRQADARKIPFSDRNFDIVVAMDFLEHVRIEDRPQVIKEMVRVSKDCLFIGVPLKGAMVQTAEEQVRSQFFATTGREHPFLIEHENIGLPEESEVDALLTEAGVKFFKVREGNLMNWYLQQLYTGAHWGESGFDKYGFYTFYNEHLLEVGNLRPPTYRTIYCVTGDSSVSETEIYTALQSHFAYNTETFMQLMRIAFDDLRFIIDGKKEQLTGMEGELAKKESELAGKEQQLRETGGKLEETVEKARRGIEAYRSAVKELRDFLQEKEQALNLVRGILKDREEKLNIAEKELAERDGLIKRLTIDLENKTAGLEDLRAHIYRTEKVLQEKNEEIVAARGEIDDLRTELTAHGRALSEITHSRAWRAVMVYSKVKMALMVRPARLAVKGWKILTKLGPKVFMQRAARKIRRGKADGAENGGYGKLVSETALTPVLKKEMRRKSAAFEYRPLISIVMPVYNVNEKWLSEAIESVQAQLYDKWELCICDDASTLPHVRPLLEKFAAQDKRIKVVYRQKNGGIVRASNDAIALATGAYVGLLDNDDRLAADALSLVVESLQEKKYDLIYSDEDKIGPDGERCEPFFKPDWSPDLLLSCNYVSHFGVYKRKIINEIGGFREGYDGSQDYDLVLRFTERTQEIKHIPRVLYHWRKVKGSSAESIEAKPYAYEAARKALAAAARRRKMNATVEDGLWTGSYRVRRAITGGPLVGSDEDAHGTAPLVSIIIPFRDKVGMLDKCLRSIYEKTSWRNFEVLIVDNDSELLETADYLERISANFANLTVLRYGGGFNYSAINNYAAAKAKGDYLVLLNNDTEVVSPDWIESMLEHAQRKEVGAVGAKLFFPDGTIQHAGVVIGLGGLANHAFSRQTDIDHGYFGLINVVRNYSAVTAACLMVRKDVFFEIGGMDAQNLVVAFNDVDFCLKLREKGYLVVYTPYAVLRHYESLSRGYEVDLGEVAYMQRRHAGLLEKGDPYYNPNLTREKGDFSLRVMDKVAR